MVTCARILSDNGRGFKLTTAVSDRMRACDHLSNLILSAPIFEPFPGSGMGMETSKKAATQSCTFSSYKGFQKDGSLPGREKSAAGNFFFLEVGATGRLDWCKSPLPSLILRG